MIQKTAKQKREWDKEEGILNQESKTKVTM
jgi:hypothetical protein